MTVSQAPELWYKIYKSLNTTYSNYFFNQDKNMLYKNRYTKKYICMHIEIII